MKRPTFSHVLTVLVIAWLGILVVAGIIYPDRAQQIFDRATATVAEDEGAAASATEHDAAAKDSHGPTNVVAKFEGAVASAPRRGDATKDTREPTDRPNRPESQLARIDLRKLSENSLSQWMIFVSAIFVGILAGRICASVLSRVGQRLDTRGWIARAHLANDLVGPANLVLISMGLMVGLAALTMSRPLEVFCRQTELLLYSIAVFWYGYNLVSVVEAGLLRITARSDAKLDAQLVPLIRKTLRVVLVVIGVLFVVDSVFQQDIGAWLAGLGIAGLAVSLAAQDSLKNLFGSITILLDRPFHVGERIIYGGFDGTVEEIGFRSTKVRTFTGNLVTIPNSTIVNSAVENPGRRPYIRRTMDVTITYDVSREKIEQAVEILRAILDEEGIREPIHPTIKGDEFPPRVFFKGYGAASLDIFVIYWYAPPAYWDDMEHAQRLNLRIFEEFDKAGIEFAFPTQTLYLAGDPKRKLALEMLGKDLSDAG